MNIPVVLSMPFKESKDVLAFLSQKMDDKNRIFLQLQSMIAFLEVKGFRTVCPVCSVDKLMRPDDHKLLNRVKSAVFTIKEESSCPDRKCY